MIKDTAISSFGCIDGFGASFPSHRDAGGAGRQERQETSPAFLPCYLIQHEDGWQIFTPMQFIPVEEA